MITTITKYVEFSDQVQYRATVAQKNLKENTKICYRQPKPTLLTLSLQASSSAASMSMASSATVAGRAGVGATAGSGGATTMTLPQARAVLKVLTVACSLECQV